MPFTSLLAVAVLFSSPLTNSVPPPSHATPLAVTAAAAPSYGTVASDWASGAQGFELHPLAQADDPNAVLPPDTVCYKIRAYIFKRDDDHAPEFVRSTTCGPGTPHTKNTAWPKAKLVPAK